MSPDLERAIGVGRRRRVAGLGDQLRQDCERVDLVPRFAQPLRSSLGVVLRLDRVLVR